MVFYEHPYLVVQVHIIRLLDWGIVGNPKIPKGVLNLTIYVITVRRRDIGRKKCPKKKHHTSIALFANEQIHCNDVWVLDFGALYHTSPRRELFTTYEQVDRGNVSMANSVVCKTVGICSIKIQTHDGTFYTLNVVRHVLQMTKNLISLSLLDSNGFSFRGGVVVVYVRKGQRMC